MEDESDIKAIFEENKLKLVCWESCLVPGDEGGQGAHFFCMFEIKALGVFYRFSICAKFLLTMGAVHSWHCHR